MVSKFSRCMHHLFGLSYAITKPARTKKGPMPAHRAFFHTVVTAIAANITSAPRVLT